MTNGDSIKTICDRLTGMINGEDVTAYSMEPQSYVYANEDGTDVIDVYYQDCPQLPETTTFFEN